MLSLQGITWASFQVLYCGLRITQSSWMSPKIQNVWARPFNQPCQIGQQIHWLLVDTTITLTFYGQSQYHWPKLMKSFENMPTIACILVKAKFLCLMTYDRQGITGTYSQMLSLSTLVVVWKDLKGIVHQTMKFLSSFTRPDDVPHLCEVFFLLLWNTKDIFMNCFLQLREASVSLGPIGFNCDDKKKTWSIFQNFFDL